MCKSLRSIYRIIEEILPTIFISIGSLAILIGIAWSIYIASLNKTDINTLWSSLTILGGTFLLGWGFYLKVTQENKRESKQGLSDYGQFMLGLATLITLPQAPEMLKHILKIETAVTKLQNLQEDQDGKAKARESTPIRSATTPAEIEGMIRGLVREEDAKAHESSQRELDNDEPTVASPSRAQETFQQRWNPNLGMGHKTPNLKVAPIPGMAYLTPEKADKIIKTLEAKGFDKNTAEALVQENLEVWHPMDRTSKRGK